MCFKYCLEIKNLKNFFIQLIGIWPFADKDNQSVRINCDEPFFADHNLLFVAIIPFSEKLFTDFAG